MKKMLIACAAGAVFVSSLSGCQTTAASSNGDVAAVEDRSTALRQGEGLSVRLLANPSTGFAWVLRPWDEAVLTRSTPFEAIEAGQRGDGLVGAPGEAVWRFSAGTRGTVTLIFDYRQPWSNEAPARTAAFPVTVR